MERYVVHKGVYCQVFEQGWKVKQWQCSETGQAELMAWKRRVYVPLGDFDDPELRPKDVDQSGTELEKERLERQRLAGLERSAARAKRTCRYKIKSAGLSSLLTCTYRENMTDFDRVRNDWAAMLRKLRKVLPGFRAVYAFEQQDRGAWHVHAAIDKLPTFIDVPGAGRVRSWDYLRRAWRAIVGADNGNIDVDGHRKTRHGLPGKYRTSESLAKLAGYVSKYLTKEHSTGIPGRNKWGSTQGIEVAKPVVFDLPEMSLAEVVQLAFHVPDGHRVVSHRVGQFGKFWVLYSEPAPVDDSSMK
ncbi:MAG: hypothetical protein QE290_10645 [Acidovorax sp.]|uniref:rolling circle replication-associated protein n=1 Tax=Acidovorax sp. TaxID=1872122 RepID=UPI00260F480E|nr:hypothetical protein [Acidovorax sp.]MDH4464481.1 hypothetical protein [Acidovorax sp.]